MKAHLTNVSLALLSTVFLHGCQEQGSGPVGPEGLGPQFGLDCVKQSNHPQCQPSVTYEGTFTGDLQTLAPIEFGGNLAANSDGNEQPEFFMDLSFFETFGVISDGSTCFSNTDTTRIRTLEIRPSKHDPDSASVLITFDALGTGGKKVVNYGLALRGKIIDGELPPVVGETDLEITWGPFDMHHSNGPGKKVACNGTGSLNSSTVVTATPPTT